MQPRPRSWGRGVLLFLNMSWDEDVSPVPTQDRRWGRGAGCRVRPSLTTALPSPPTEFQDDSRLNHDALPERTVVQLDASPRWVEAGQAQRQSPSHPPTCQPGAVAPWASSPLPCRYVVLFNPLEQERLSLASLLVSSPHVRVFSEEGQPLAVQISAHWSSATEMVPDVYQVSKGALALCPSAPSSHPPAYAPPGDRSPGDRHFWDLRLCWKGGWLGRVTTAQRLPHRPLVL